MSEEAEWWEPLVDHGWLPQFILRRAIRQQLQSRLREISQKPMEELHADKMAFVARLKERPIAIHTDKANEQHYEVETGLYRLTLGKRLKYSSCLYPTGRETLDEAEELMLASYVTKADVREGQAILDLGCGWGSVTLYLAQRFPTSRITAFSNSATQKIYIDGQAKEQGLSNLTVVTGDVATWDGFDRGAFDRVISVEMFEHMKNYAHLLQKVSRWLRPGGKLFVHVFCHRQHAYDFKPGDGWMSRYFFTGGTMPSSDLFLYFASRELVVEGHWLLSGTHYAQTCETWLSRLTQQQEEALQHLRRMYGDEAEARRWYYRWRLFYLSCAELFAWQGGSEWCVAHFLFSRP